jgi:hypothetical protein
VAGGFHLRDAKDHQSRGAHAHVTGGSVEKAMWIRNARPATIML